MGSPLYMQSITDQNIVLWSLTLANENMFTSTLPRVLYRRLFHLMLGSSYDLTFHILSPVLTLKLHLNKCIKRLLLHTFSLCVLKHAAIQSFLNTESHLLRVYHGQALWLVLDISFLFSSHTSASHMVSSSLIHFSMLFLFLFTPLTLFPLRSSSFLDLVGVGGPLYLTLFYTSIINFDLLKVPLISFFFFFKSGVSCFPG